MPGGVEQLSISQKPHAAILSGSVRGAGYAGSHTRDRRQPHQDASPRPVALSQPAKLALGNFVARPVLKPTGGFKISHPSYESGVRALHPASPPSSAVLTVKL